MLQEAEIVVIGSGLVGLAASLDLLNKGFKVTMIGMPSVPLPNAGNRVVALSLVSYQYLKALKAWQHLDPNCYTHYTKMNVWQKDTGVSLVLDKDDVGVDVLGYNVENLALEQALWKAIKTWQQENEDKASNFNYIQDKVSSYQNISQRHLLTTQGNQQVFATFMVVADGGNSFVRQQLGIGIDSKQYGQMALTCVVEFEQPHNNQCYQTFHTNGILAYLPQATPNQASIVWSLDNDIVEHVLNYDEQTRMQEMYLCMQTALGIPKQVSPITAFPLTKQYAQQVHGYNYALVGDAAHLIHPLAGQGVNLGFGDVWTLCDVLKDYYRKGSGVEEQFLAKWARQRKARATVVSESMFLIKNFFNSENDLVKLALKLGINVVNKVQPIKELFIKQALGYGDVAPSIASFDLDTDVTKKQQTQQTFELVNKALNELKLPNPLNIIDKLKK